MQSCSQGNVELAIREVRLVSASLPQLPFELEDASRSEEEVPAPPAAFAPELHGLLCPCSSSTTARRRTVGPCVDVPSGLRLLR